MEISTDNKDTNVSKLTNQSSNEFILTEEVLKNWEV